MIAWGDKKNDSESTKLRNEGNKLYTSRKFPEALVKYNESLCSAESNQSLALVYNNRSSVFFELKFFPQCLNNIRKARECDYPIDKISKLNDREAKCLELMRDDDEQPNPFEYFKLSYEPHPKIPFIIDGLEMRKNSQYGQHIITSRNLKVGDVISVEPPLFSVLTSDPLFKSRESTKFNYCNFCFMDNNLDLIPCDSCTSVMYCNEDCKAKDLEYHLNCDCKLSKELQKEDYLFHWFMKYFYKALSIVRGSIDELKSIYKEAHASLTPKTIFDFDFSNSNDSENLKNRLIIALSQPRNEERQEDEIALFTLCVHPELRQHETFIRKFMLLQYQVQPNFLSGTQLWSLIDDTLVPLGFDSPNFIKLIKHSCNPNVSVVNVGNKQCLVVIRPIAEGEQIFNCEGRRFDEESVSKRQSEFAPLSLACQCEACRDPARFPVKMQMRADWNDSVFLSHVELIEEFGMYKLENVPYKTLIEATDKFKSLIQTAYYADQFPNALCCSLIDVYCRWISRLGAGHGLMKSSLALFPSTTTYHPVKMQTFL